MPSNLQIILRLSQMLDQAQDIIRQQATLLALHGIETEDGTLEAERARLLADIEDSV